MDDTYNDKANSRAVDRRRGDFIQPLLLSLNTHTHVHAHMCGTLNGFRHHRWRDPR